MTQQAPRIQQTTRAMSRRCTQALHTDTHVHTVYTPHNSDALVQRALAVGGSTLAQDLVISLLLLEPVIKCELLSHLDGSACKEAQVQLTTKLQRFGIQAGVAAVVGEAGVVASLGVVNDCLISGVKHVAVSVLQGQGRCAGVSVNAAREGVRDGYSCCRCSVPALASS